MLFVIHKKRILYTVLAMATIPAIMFLFLVFNPARAVSVIFRPTGDGSSRQWSATPSSTHYLNVDDSVTQPTAADTSDYIRLLGTGRNGSEVEEFYLGTPVSDSGRVSRLDVWIYVNNLQCKGTGSSNCDRLSISILGVQSSTFGILPFSGTVTSTVGFYGWRNLSFPVSASSVVTFAGIKNSRFLMSRQAEGGGNSNNDEIRVAAIYVDVSYNPDFANSGGAGVLESTSTLVTVQKVGGATNFSGGKKQKLEGDPVEEISVPIKSGATNFGGGAETP